MIAVSEKIPEQWFESWFDSPYYHILYNNRDEKEAAAFIEKLYKYLAPQDSGRVLDLACGKGRHSVTLHKLGFNVVGVDLSAENIKAAKQQETTGLTFCRHDMRKIFEKEGFDYVFNLFTSFGYFLEREQNARALEAASANLKKGGRFVIDYLNAEKVKTALPNRQLITKGDFSFFVEKYCQDGIIHKRIEVEEQLSNQKRVFWEQVQGFTLTDFREFLANARLKELVIWGNYNLDPFEENADRLIILAEKI